MRIGLLVNPTAGRNKAGEHHEGLRGVLTRLGHEIVDYTGLDAAHAQRRLSTLAPDLDAFIVMGGDGAVQLAVNAVAETGIPLGIIPVGTGNDNATGLALPSEPGEAMKLILRQMHINPKGTPTDAMRVTVSGRETWAMATLNCGFDATVNEAANSMTFPRGGLRYVRAVMSSLGSYKPAHYRIQGDDWEWSGSAFLVGVSNIGYIGGGMHLAPESQPDDGLLDVVIVDGDIRRTEFLTVFPRVFSGSHSTHRAVTMKTTRTIHVESDDNHVVYADGEELGNLPLDAEVVPGAVRIFRGPTPPPRSDRER